VIAATKPASAIAEAGLPYLSLQRRVAELPLLGSNQETPDPEGDFGELNQHQIVGVHGHGVVAEVALLVSIQQSRNQAQLLEFTRVDIVEAHPDVATRLTTTDVADVRCFMDPPLA
jgi:hypothetical protein